MHFPFLSTRVRVNGRDGEFVIVRVDHSVSEADLCPVTGTAEIERNVPFNLLHSAPEYLPAEFHVNTRDRLAAASHAMESCRAQIASSHAAVATLRNLLSTTLESIHASQLRIVESDRIIARARSGIFPWARPTE